MKLEIEVDVREETVDKKQLEERLRKEAILALFAHRKIPAGNEGARFEATPVYGTASKAGNSDRGLHD